MNNVSGRQARIGTSQVCGSSHNHDSVGIAQIRKHGAEPVVERNRENRELRHQASLRVAEICDLVLFVFLLSHGYIQGFLFCPAQDIQLEDLVDRMQVQNTDENGKGLDMPIVGSQNDVSNF